MPVTFCSRSLSMRMNWPIASASPNKAFAVDSVITIEVGSSNACCWSPLIKGWTKTLSENLLIRSNHLSHSLLAHLHHVAFAPVGHADMFYLAGHRGQNFFQRKRHGIASSICPMFHYGFDTTCKCCCSSHETYRTNIHRPPRAKSECWIHRSQ